VAQYDINLREYWRILRKRKFVVILVTIIVGAFSTTFAMLRAPSPLYSTTCSVKFEKQNTLESVFGLTISWSEPQDIDTQISVVKSYPVFQRVAAKLGLISPAIAGGNELVETRLVSVIEGLQNKVKVSRQGLTNIIDITATDRDPVFAQKLANTVAVAYKEFHFEQQMKRIKETLKYIDSQLKDVREKLRKAEEEFNRFSQEHELISIDLQSESLLARKQELQKEIRNLHEQRNELQNLVIKVKEFIENPFSPERDFYSSKAGSQYQSANDALVGLLLKRDTLLKDFTPKHPDVVAVNNQIVENARKMVLLLQEQLRGIDKREADLKAELEKVNEKTRVLMDRKLEFDRLKRKVALYSDMVALLEKKNQEAHIKSAERPEEVNIVRPALLPTLPINPPKTAATGAMGVFIGLVLGLVIAFVVETFDTSLGAIEDVEETLGTHVLGVVPHADVQNLRNNLKENYPDKIGKRSLAHAASLVSHFSPKSMMAESFRALRTNVNFRNPEKKIKTIAVTSASSEEGKTLVATNLAITMAQGGMKTLLIGSDLRKPVLCRVFGVEKTPGLTDILLGNLPWRDAAKTVTDLIMGKMSLDEVTLTPGLDNLHLITSGAIPPNPTELIESKSLEDFIKEARKEYDIIIFDSTPILSTADAAILGTKVDGVLLVYRVGSVSRGLLKRATSQLNQVECNLLGVVLNGMKPDVSPDFQDYKYYSYYYAYGEDHKKGKRKKKKRGFAFTSEPEESFESTQVMGIERPGERGDQARDHHSQRLLLLLVGACFLVGGVLWQSGTVNFSGWAREVIPYVRGRANIPPKKEPHSSPAPRKEETTSPGAKSVVKGTAGARVQGPIASYEEKGNPKGVALAGLPETASKEGKVVSPGKSPATAKVPGARLPAPSSAHIETAAREVVASAPGSKPNRRAIEAHKSPPSNKPKYIPKPYSLRLGAFRTLGQAEKAVSSFKRRGLSVYWAKVDLGDKGTWYRVFVGRFESAEKAREFKEKHKLEGSLVKKAPYADLIGVYSNREDLEKITLCLRKLGFSPYAVKDLDGKYRVLVGAFMTREGAEQQRVELASKGIKSRVVNR